MKVRQFAVSALALFATFAVWADTETVGGITWTYTIKGKTAEVANGSRSAIPDTTTGDIVIPSSLGGNLVTSIGNYAFRNCSGLTSVEIPSSVTSIGGNAFTYCSGLTSVTIPSSVTSIGHWAFFGCSGLASVTIPSSVTSIGAYAFDDCKGLTSVTISEGVEGIGAYAFYDCSGLTSVAIPSSVTSIGDSAFSGCSGLTSVTIPSSVTSIGNHAFEDCSGLTSVTISEGVEGIGDYAFYGCSGLTSVTIPSSVTSIGASAFYFCRGLTSVTISEGVEGIGDSAFSECKGLTSVTIPSTVTSIGDYAFSGCEMLESVTVLATDQPEGGLKMFGGCYGDLFAIFVPQDSVENYRDADGWNAYVKNIRAIGEERPGSKDNPWEIGLMDAADVKAWTSGTKLVIEGASAMCDFTILNKAPWYELGSLLTEVVIEEGVASIGGFAFSGCSGLTSVKIPSSVTSIGANAFNDCKGLTSVTIPSSVTSIGNNAFYNCSKLGSVLVMASDPPTCENGAFDRVAVGFVIRVPSESVCKYNSANGWKAYERSIQGACVAGDNALAWMDGTTFVVEGTGAMYDFANAEDVPWAEAVGLATAVTIADTVTHIGGNALAGLKDAATVNGTPVAIIRPYAQGFCSAGTVIPDDMVLVAQTELQAAKAEAVTVADGVVSLGVTVNTNGNFTAETKSWQPVELTSDNVEVKDGKIVISIPVDSPSGFMILQSGDAKVGVTSGGGPAANHAVQVAGGLYVGGEEPVVRIGEIDTQVLDNTAVKANDNSSDK